MWICITEEGVPVSASDSAVILLCSSLADFVTSFSILNMHPMMISINPRMSRIGPIICRFLRRFEALARTLTQDSHLSDKLELPAIVRINPKIKNNVPITI